MVGFAVLFVSGGSRFALGLMLKPMTQDLGWGRALVSIVGTLFMAVSALGQPLVGRLVDRYNPLKIVGTGLVLSITGIALMGTISSVWHALLVYGVIFAMGQAATSVTAVSVMVSRAYGRRRGFATSVAISGSATGQLVIMSLIASLLTYLGWRQAYGLLGAVNLIIVVALAVGIRGMFRHFDVPTIMSDAISHASAGPPGRLFSLPEMRPLVVVYAICGLQDFFVSTHVVAFATDHGVSAVLAGNVLALMGLMGLIGVLASGALSDAFGPTVPTALNFLVRFCLFGYILFMHDATSILIFALAYGATFMVTAPLAVVFAERAAGSRHMGRVSGVIIMVHQIAGGLGALVGGTVFDRWGSYDKAFMLMCALCLVAIGTTWWLKGKRHPALPPDAIVPTRP